MIDEKNPGRESVDADGSDDEIIIDLTDEVDVKPEDKNRILNLTADMADDASGGAEPPIGLDAESDEDELGLDDTDIFTSPPGGTAKMETLDAAEDQLIETVVEESLESDLENARKSGEAFDSEASLDDNVLIIDNAPETEIEVPTRADSHSPAESQLLEDELDLEEEIGLEYEADDDEENLLDLDLERNDDTQDFVDMMLDSSKASDHLDDDYDPTQYSGLESEELDDIVWPEDDQEDESEVLATPDDARELIDSDELPDLQAISDLDFEDIDDTRDEDDSQTPKSDELLGGDDILAGIGQAPSPVDDTEAQDTDETATLELDEIENFPGLIDPHEADQEILSLADDEPHPFEEETDALDLEDGLEPDLDDDVIPLDGLKGMPDDPEEEIIEISEFDQHFSVKGETLLKQTGILDPSSLDEDDFLELIDVEEDILSEDQEVVEFGEPRTAGANESDDRIREAELEEAESRSTDSESIFSDEVEDRMLEVGISDSEPEVSPEDKDGSHREAVLGFGEENMEPRAGSPDDDAEIPSPPEAIFPESENFDFSIDPGSIAKQVDQLDTFLTGDQPGEPGNALFPSDYPEAEDTGETATDEAFTSQGAEASTANPADPIDSVAASDESPTEEFESEDAGTGIDSEVFPSIPVSRIDAAIERVINEKFAGKIEDIIYEVIEKAVAKEISRLKGALLGDNEPE